MRDLKRSNALLPAYKQLSQAGMEVFTPMVSRVFSRNGKRIRKEVPFMQDLLFVNDVRQNLDLIVAKTPTLQYRFKKGGKYCEPIVIPQDAMTRFIGATQASANPKYYAMDEISDLMCGRNIRMIGGVLDGYEGKLQTIPSGGQRRDKRRVYRVVVNRPTYSLFVLVLFLKLLS